MNNEKLYALAGGINDDFVAETMKPKAARPRYLRYIAAAAAVLLIAGGAFGIVKASGEEKPAGTENNGGKISEADATEDEGTMKTDDKWANLPEGYEFMADTTVPEDAVLPPDDHGMSLAEYARSYTFHEAFDEADTVCIVTVGDYLGPISWAEGFKAKPEKLYKGSLPEEITLLQFVSGRKPQPFRFGEKLLLFLKKKGDVSYEVVGANIAQLYCAAYEGSVYCVGGSLLDLASRERDKEGRPRNISPLSSLMDEDDLLDVPPEKMVLLDGLKEYLMQFDPKFGSWMLTNVYRIEDLESLFEAWKYETPVDGREMHGN